MLWRGFPLFITIETEKIICHYNVFLIQLPLFIVLIYERVKFLNKTFSLKFGDKEIVSLIEFVEDQWQIYAMIDVFFHSEHDLSFTREPLMSVSRCDNAYIVIRSWTKASFWVKNNCHCK